LIIGSPVKKEFFKNNERKQKQIFQPHESMVLRAEIKLMASKERRISIYLIVIII